MGGTEETFDAYWDRFHGRDAVMKLTERLLDWPPGYVLATLVLIGLAAPPCWYFRKNIYSAIVMPLVISTFLSVAAITLVALAGFFVMGHHQPPLMLSQRP
jgi:hypothetical protein